MARHGVAELLEFQELSGEKEPQKKWIPRKPDSPDACPGMPGTSSLESASAAKFRKSPNPQKTRRNQPEIWLSEAPRHSTEARFDRRSGIPATPGPLGCRALRFVLVFQELSGEKGPAEKVSVLEARSEEPVGALRRNRRFRRLDSSGARL